MMEANIGRVTAIKKKTNIIKKEIASVREQLRQMDKNQLEDNVKKSCDFLAQVFNGGIPKDQEDTVWSNIMPGTMS